MNEGEKTQEERLLEEQEVSAELIAIVEKNALPQKIAQRILEKLKEKNIKITKNQLHKLIDRIQNALQLSPISSPMKHEQFQRKEQEVILDDTALQTNDMKKLIEAVEQLTRRITIIEENQIHGVKNTTGPLIKTTDIKTPDPLNILDGNMQPLQHIPQDPESIVVIMKWLQYLVDRIGKNNLADTLGYYVDIGWISEDARFDLINYSKGITEDPSQITTDTPQLPAKDHLQSLLFIQKIRGVNLDDRFLSRIERDMDKIVRSLEEYHQN
ncbi:MAG: hypothetical protein JW840_10390 [Candidatus Thermoplasmatota archaeon]|nr:hypothetical protein [Candidatus Thermoplasmatota archaeon]